MSVSKCSTCGAKMRRGVVTFDIGPIVSLPQVIVENIRALVCPKNHAPQIEGGDVEAVMRRIAEQMAVGPHCLTGCEVRYVRKYLGDTLVAFARRLNVSSATLAGWERASSTELETPTSAAIRTLVAELLANFKTAG